MYSYNEFTVGCYSGWRRYENNPVIGREWGECFDVFVLPRQNGGYRMYFSWRTKRCIALTESNDGFKWSDPQIVLAPSKSTNWEDDVNRMSIVHKDGKYQMWYTGMTIGTIKDYATGSAKIGYSESVDGIKWERFNDPVMIPDLEWEQNSIMCPHVNWNEEKNIYQMYYSAGGWYEPDIIAYAESRDGCNWEKRDKPVLWPIYRNLWERERTTACQVLYHKGWYYMFYIGFEDIHKARVCFARSKDGISKWERHPMNPIIGPGHIGGWDCEAEYKPFVIWEEENNRWLMWVNGRQGYIEQIGIMIHDGEDLGFDDLIPKTTYE
jgi:sucrose-6-phosphate hydrolase SacC (GH32 family)